VIAAPGKVSQLSIYSDHWNDLSKFRKEVYDHGYNISHISSTPMYLQNIEEPSNTVFIVVGLERKYSTQEVDVILKYLNRGGNVILADDFGYGNSFIKKMDEIWGYNNYDPYGPVSIGYEFSKDKIIDVQYYKDPNYISVGTSTVEKFELLLNAPSALVLRDDISTDASKYFQYSEVLAQTSSLSWLDLNSNYSRDLGEQEGPFPIIMRFSDYLIKAPSSNDIRSSNLILISDPSIFINEMFDEADNKDFSIYLIDDLLKSGGKVIFDESVHLSENGITDLLNSFYYSMIIFYSNYGFLAILLLIFFSIVFAFMLKRRPKTKFQKHKDILDTKRIYYMQLPEIGTLDYYWIRTIFLEKIRTSYDIPYDVFFGFDKEKLTKLIQDDELIDFTFRSPYLKFEKYYLYRIIPQIINWRSDRKLAEDMSKLIKKSDKSSLSESARADIIFKKIDLEKVTKESGQGEFIN
jgi:hypothetical protein